MRMVENGWRVKYMTFRRFLDEIRNCKMRRPDESGDISQTELYYDRLRQYKVLCLDEIVGKTKSGENVMETLYEIIDMAYNGMLCPLWLIGNVRDKSMESLFGDETGAVMRRLQSLRFKQITLTREGVGVK
jgi:DNA replication protein DnaC